LRISEVPSLNVSSIIQHSCGSCFLIKCKLVKGEVEVILEIYRVVQRSVVKTITVTTLTEQVNGVTQGGLLDHGRIFREALNPVSWVHSSAMHPHDWAHGVVIECGVSDSVHGKNIAILGDHINQLIFVVLVGVSDIF